MDPIVATRDLARYARALVRPPHALSAHHVAERFFDRSKYTHRQCALLHAFRRFHEPLDLPVNTMISSRLKNRLMPAPVATSNGSPSKLRTTAKRREKTVRALH